MAKAKKIKGLNCNSTAAPNIQKILITRFEELYELREAALNWDDPEGVHAMRVASRRLRSALRDFAPFLPKRELTSVIKRTRSIADALGEVRDQDVAIQALEKIETQAPPGLSSSFKQLIENCKAIRDEAREELKSILAKSQLKQLKSDFLAGVEEATAERKTKRIQSPAELEFWKMSRTIILNRLRELEHLSNELFKPFEVESLHEMRIAVKRLRYALELFHQCWPHSVLTDAKRASRIQAALGDVHDCDIWIETLGKSIAEARKHKKEKEVDAFVWLLTHFVKLRTRHLRQAVIRWRHWETRNVGGKLRTKLHSQPRGTRSRRSLPGTKKGLVQPVNTESAN
jgi:CHAD domain-containing protein